MDTNIILGILLSWAAHLSGYPMPDALPEVRLVPHQYLVDNACGGVECAVVGWYNDQRIIYIDDTLSDFEDGFTSTLLVHEMTHYLQDISGEFDTLSCVDSVARERAAYYVQTVYAIATIASPASIHLARGSLITCAYTGDHTND